MTVIVRASAYRGSASTSRVLRVADLLEHRRHVLPRPGVGRVGLREAAGDMHRLREVPQFSVRPTEAKEPPAIGDSFG
ncbi:MAG: hypothetical protein ACYTJ0_20420 [Planctomycetota bacterium]|jgi:hypothetical protein